MIMELLVLPLKLAGKMMIALVFITTRLTKWETIITFAKQERRKALTFTEDTLSIANR